MWAELASVEGRTAADICAMTDETTEQVSAMVKEIFGTSWVPAAKKLVTLGTYDGAMEGLSNWACGATDPDGMCKDEPVYLTQTDFTPDSTTYGAAGADYCQGGKTKVYRVTVQTADGFLSGYGTDSDMDLRITGTLGSTGWVRLNRLKSGQLFEDEDKDVLTFKACDVGDPQKVELDFYDNYPLSDWCLEYIEVRGCGRWKFKGWMHQDTRVKAIKPSFTCDTSSLDGSGDYNGADRDVVDHSCESVPSVSERQCSNEAPKPTINDLQKQLDEALANKGRPCFCGSVTWLMIAGLLFRFLIVSSSEN
jgi:hypothetical protein